MIWEELVFWLTNNPLVPLQWIKNQVEIAVEEASLIVFMTDATTGITDLDDEMAKVLRRSGKPVILAVNKVDNNNRMLMASEFYGLGSSAV